MIKAGRSAQKARFGISALPRAPCLRRLYRPPIRQYGSTMPHEKMMMASLPGPRVRWCLGEGGDGDGGDGDGGDGGEGDGDGGDGEGGDGGAGPWHVNWNSVMAAVPPQGRSGFPGHWMLHPSEDGSPTGVALLSQ